MWRAGSRPGLLLQLCHSPSFSSSPASHGCLRDQRLQMLAVSSEVLWFLLSLTAAYFLIQSFQQLYGKEEEICTSTQDHRNHDEQQH